MLPPFPWIDVAIIAALIVLNGVFAMSELSIVSSRRARLEALARSGSAGARAAIELAADPGKFLSTVQVGITLVSVLAGVFGGARLTARLQSYLESVPALAPFAESLSLAAVVVSTTFLTLVLGVIVMIQQHLLPWMIPS